MGREIELGRNRYSIGRLSAMQQLHVSRRIAPIVPALIPVFLSLRGKVDRGDDLEGLATALQPLADGLAGLKDEDAEYVVGTCLSAVQRWQETGWARVWAIEQKRLMFDDMDMGVILPLVVQVVVANLGPFIQGLLTSQASSPDPAAQAG
ncbi:Bacteriophage protein [Cupriavidus sp. H19C3]|uniref:phage tail assembly chaperone n=1 Tax=Cupriavidus sp. H19C3 TaxID=3241603 RepID=UPI003BF7996E